MASIIIYVDFSNRTDLVRCKTARPKLFGCFCEAQIEPARKTCYKQHFYPCSGRQSSLWLHLWNQCHVLCGGVPAAQHDELPGRVLWLCGQHTGLLSAAHGGPLRYCSLCLFTVSTNARSHHIQILSCLSSFILSQNCFRLTPL